MSNIISFLTLSAKSDGWCLFSNSEKLGGAYFRDFTLVHFAATFRIKLINDTQNHKIT